MKATWRYWMLSILSGVAWSGVAWIIGASSYGTLLWGGVIAAPAIGLAVGVLTRPWRRLSKPVRVVLALAALYLAAMLFGLAMGIYDWVSEPRAGRIATGVILQAPMGVLWGVTFTGYFVLLWPMAYLNLWLLSRREA